MLKPFPPPREALRLARTLRRELHLRGDHTPEALAGAVRAHLEGVEIAEAGGQRPFAGVSKGGAKLIVLPRLVAPGQYWALIGFAGQLLHAPLSLEMLDEPMNDAAREALRKILSGAESFAKNFAAAFVDSEGFATRLIYQAGIAARKIHGIAGRPTPAETFRLAANFALDVRPEGRHVSFQRSRPGGPARLRFPADQSNAEYARSVAWGVGCLLVDCWDLTDDDSDLPPWGESEDADALAECFAAGWLGNPGRRRHRRE